MKPKITTQIPEPGQLVEVRKRKFVVAEINRSTLPPDLFRKGIDSQSYRVVLSSVEDDALGEELQIIWELEPGTKILERASLPELTGFDEPRKLDAFINAVMWGAISPVDDRALQSPFRSGIEIEEYQLDPVVRALRMPRVNLLIADDVGLGKTIESGLVAQELILRHRVRSIIIVCPASIQIQWRDQMRDKFGLEFRIVDSGLMKDLRRRRGIHVNPWAHFPRLITSVDYLKRERPLRLFRETLPAHGESIYPRKYDLLIVDECHNVAPSAGGRYATDSLRTTCIRELSPHFEHKLFLTATPHNGYWESFTALLELLDSQRFARGIRPSVKELEKVMIRRMKNELKLRWDGTRRFAERIIDAIEVSYTDIEKKAHQLLNEYTKQRGKNSDKDVEKYASEFVLKLLKKRLFSSPAAFESTLLKHKQTLSTNKKPGFLEKPSLGLLRRQIESIDEDYADDDTYESATQESIEIASSVLHKLDNQENKILNELIPIAEMASKKPDSKASELIKWLHTHLKSNGQWNDERVLIFTEYRATQNWLLGLLAAEGFTQGERLLTMYGGMDSNEREKIKAAFQASPSVSPVRILLATDAASEGIDLQNYCNKLIHYEIPWNPAKMEQRNGRLDRHGQKAEEVQIFHFVGAGYIKKEIGGPGEELEGDLEFLMKAVEKTEAIREDIGKVGPIIASQVEEAMLGKRKSLNTDNAEQEAQSIRKIFKFERKLKEELDKLHQQLAETTSDLRVSPKNIQKVVEIGLKLAEQPPLTEIKMSHPDHTGDVVSCPVFSLPAMSGSWAKCTEGLAHPHTGEIRPIVFDPNYSKGRDDVVLVHLNHRLVQMCQRLLRAEIWSHGDHKLLHRFSARMIYNGSLTIPAVIAHGRIVVIGGDNQRIHEEIIMAGGLIKEGRFSRMNVGQTEEVFKATSGHDVPKAVKSRLRKLWPRIEDPLLKSLENRMAERTRTLQQKLDERAEKQIQDMKAILLELEKNIRTEIEEPSVQQLEFWTTPEREQLELNMSSLKRRLDNIPEEIEKETQVIKNRFRNPESRLFPVSVMFLIPYKIAIELERGS